MWELIFLMVILKIPIAYLCWVVYWAIKAEPQLELVGSGELSAVCFRYRGTSRIDETTLNQLNASILKHTQKRGRIYLSNATLAGKFCLRACIVNHRTRDSDIDAIVPEVVAAAKELAAPEKAR